MVGRRGSSLALTALLALELLVGCDTRTVPEVTIAAPLPPHAAPTAVPEPPKPLAAMPQKDVPRPRAKPAPAGIRTAERQDTLQARTEMPPPIKLVGLDESAILALLGEPVQTADAPPGKVWQYAEADCSIELFFYLDVASNSFHVLQYQALGELPGDSNGRCLQRIYENAARR